MDTLRYFRRFGLCPAAAENLATMFQRISQSEFEDFIAELQADYAGLAYRGENCGAD